MRTTRFRLQPQGREKRSDAEGWVRTRVCLASEDRWREVNHRESIMRSEAKEAVEGASKDSDWESRSGRVGAFGFPALLQPLPLADSGLEMRRHGGDLLAAGDHGAAHLVAVGVH